MKHIRNTLRSDFSPVILSDSREGRFSHVFALFSGTEAGASIVPFRLLSAVSADRLINTGERSMTGGEGYVIVPSIYSAGVFTGIYRLRGGKAANEECGGGMYHGYNDRFHGDNDRFNEDNDRFHGDNDRFNEDNDRYHGDNDRFNEDNDRYHGDNDRFNEDNDRFNGDNDRFNGAPGLAGQGAGKLENSRNRAESALTRAKGGLSVRFHHHFGFKPDRFKPRRRRHTHLTYTEGGKAYV
jgi:hypothetical protein